MILDKLMEKKHLEIYIKVRKEILKKDLQNIKDYPPKQRGFIQERVKGRMKELDTLKRALKQFGIRRMGIRYWREIYKK